VADPTINAIDKFFDFLDKGVDAADRVLNRGKHLEEQQTERRKRRQVHEVIEATSVEKPVKKTASPGPVAATSTAIARKPHFYIKESVDPRSGATIYVVTDGRNARTECSTREFATKILRALEKTP
jgi:hypothetical protein